MKTQALVRRGLSVLCCFAAVSCASADPDLTVPNGTGGKSVGTGTAGASAPGGTSGGIGGTSGTSGTSGGIGGTSGTSGTSGGIGGTSGTSGGIGGTSGGIGGTSGGIGGTSGTSGTSGGIGGTSGTSGGIGGIGGNMNVAGINSGGSAGTASAGAGAATAGGMAGTSAGAAGTGSWMFPAGVAKPRIMIVGDSISAGPGCYKKYLLRELTDHGYTAFEFVGEYSDDCGGGVRHSAVSCSTAAHYTQDTFMMSNCQQGTSFAGLSRLVTEHKPDLIMLQLGVNDVWGGTPTPTILARYKTLVEQARAQNPAVALVVAQIQKIRPDCGSDDSIQKRAEDLIMAVPAWAEQLSTAQSPVFVADLWTNSDWTMAETLDCVHPNDVGAQKMGTNWFNALKKILTPG